MAQETLKSEAVTLVACLMLHINIFVCCHSMVTTNSTITHANLMTDPCRLCYASSYTLTSDLLPFLASERLADAVGQLVAPR